MSNAVDSNEEYNVDGMGQTTKNSNPGRLFAATMDVVFSVLVAVLCGFFVYWSFSADGVVLFAWHPALLTTGFILFMTEAINIYNNALLLSTGSKSHSNRVLAHWALHTCGMICIVLGFGAIVWNKIRLDKSHFQSPHAIVGLTTIILMLLAACGGIATKYSFQLRRKVRPVLLKVGHSFFGLCVYWLGGTTLILGVFTKWFEKNRTTTDAYFAISAIVVIWIYTSIRPLGQIFRRLRQMCTSI